MAYRALEKLVNLHDGYRRAFRLDHREVLLLQEDGECHLIDRRCPHQGQVLDTALVVGRRLNCPRHDIQFCLSGGPPQPPICPALVIHELVYEGSSVGIEDERYAAEQI